MPTGRDGHRNPDILPVPLNGDGAEQRGALLEAMADIRLQWGRYRDETLASLTERKRLLRQLRPMQFQPQVFVLPSSGAVNQTIDVPEIMGPKDEYCWDVRFIRLGTNTSGGSFSGATISAHRGQSASATAFDQNEIFESTSNSSFNFSSGTVMLMPGDRMVYQATATNMTAGVSIMCYGSFIQVPLALLGDYLL